MVGLVVGIMTLMGLLLGSAINAVVWRMYVGKSWARGRSMCPDCGHQLAAKDLVPVVSWLWLKGRCRYCGKRIHWQYPIVEVLTAALFGLSAWVLTAGMGLSSHGDFIVGLRLGFWILMLVLLIILAVYDLRWLLLPDKIMVPLIGVAGVYVAVMAALTAWWWPSAQAWHMAVGPVVAAISGGGAFYALVVGSKGRAMGGGDIKLAFAMGLILGLQGLAVAMLLAFNVAAIMGLVLIGLRRRKRRDQIPFGPFLVGGTIVAFLWGRDLVDWYLRLNGLY